MKKITYTIGFAFAMLATSNAIAQQGFGTNRPDKSAAVEIKSPNKGLLIPRVTLLSETDVTTITNPANSLLIYNEGTTGTLRKGYYYYDTAKTTWIPFLDASNNTVTAANGLRMDGNTVKLGGTITEDTKIILDTNKKIMIQGLTPVTSMAEQVIAVGHYQTGHVQVATPEQIVTAGLTHNLTSADNVMTSTINGTPKTADIINKNDLSVAITETTPGVVDKVDLKSTVNGVHPATVDIKPAIQAGQIKYELTSTGKTVDITTAAMVDNVIKINLETDVNDGIVVGNGIEKDATGKVILGGKLEKATTIITDNNPIMIQGLSVVGSMADQMIAVGHKTTGEVKVAHPGQIVSNTLVDGSGTDAVYDANLQTNKVDLGGPLTKDAAIDTGNYKMFISGLEDADIVENRIGNYEVMVVDGTSGELRTANTGQIIDKGLRNGSAINIKYDTTVSSHVVNLGGAVKDRSEIITDDKNILAISGLVNNEVAYQNVVTVAANGNLQQTTLNTGVQITAANSIKTVDYTALINDETILVNTTANDVAITIPAATTANNGKRFLIKSVGTDEGHNHVLKIQSTSKIDGSNQPIESSSPYQSWLLQSNGSEWFVIGY